MKCINNIFPEEFDEVEYELNSLAYTPLVKDALLKFISRIIRLCSSWRIRLNLDGGRWICSSCCLFL